MYDRLPHSCKVHGYRVLRFGEGNGLSGVGVCCCVQAKSPSLQKKYFFRTLNNTRNRSYTYAVHFRV